MKAQLISPFSRLSCGGLDRQFPHAPPTWDSALKDAETMLYIVTVACLQLLETNDFQLADCDAPMFVKRRILRRWAHKDGDRFRGRYSVSGSE